MISLPAQQIAMDGGKVKTEEQAELTSTNPLWWIFTSTRSCALRNRRATQEDEHWWMYRNREIEALLIFLGLWFCTNTRVLEIISICSPSFWLEQLVIGASSTKNRLKIETESWMWYSWPIAEKIGPTRSVELTDSASNENGKAIERQKVEKATQRETHRRHWKG